jgi:uncharacterized membrane protein YhaH (DUF805 family)
MSKRQDSVGLNVLVSRVGRVQFLNYSMALFALLVWPGLYLYYVLSTSIQVYFGHVYHLDRAFLVFMLIVPPAFFTWLTIRRLHDIGCSGWWIVLFVIIYLWLLLALAYTDGKRIRPFFFYEVIVPILPFVMFYIALLFIPGTSGVNRFGAQTVPVSRWTQITAVLFSLVCVGWISFPVVSEIRHEQMVQHRVDDALTRAVAAEKTLRAYFLEHNNWPDSIAVLFPSKVITSLEGGFQPPFDFWKSQGGGIVIDAPLLDKGHLIKVYGFGPPPGVAAWSLDGGKTWHCGAFGLDRGKLPKSCRESHIPRPLYPVI